LPALVLVSACGGDPATSESGDPGKTKQPSDAGWAAFGAWDALPVFETARASQDSSKDRSETMGVAGISDPGNKDFNNFVAVCGDRPNAFLGDSDGAPCDPDIDGYVIASADDGPGFISRLYLSVGTIVGPGNITNDFTTERLRIYADDLTTPAFESSVVDFESGTTAPFVPPLLSVKSASVVSYVPISYQSKMRVVLDDLLTSTTTYYYQVDRRSSGATVTFDVAASTAVEAANVALVESGAAGLDGTTPWADADFTVNAAQTTSILDQKGPGTVHRLELTVDGSPTALDDLALQIVWDDQATPAIDVPLAALFASNATVTSFDTLPMSVTVQGTQTILRLTLPMPFATHAVVALVNAGTASYTVHARLDGVAEAPASEWGYLHATRNETMTPPDGTHYTALDVTGRGKYVGTAVHFVGGSDPTATFQSPFNFLEGDDLETADGAPATKGTGTEEYFDGAWYFNTGAFAAPFSAVTYVGAGASANTGEVAAVKWQLPGDSISFQDSFDIGFEYGANVPATAQDYESVAFYYAK
jgi:hypothetical protein